MKILKRKEFGRFALCLALTLLVCGAVAFSSTAKADAPAAPVFTIDNAVNGAIVRGSVILVSVQPAENLVKAQVRITPNDGGTGRAGVSDTYHMTHGVPYALGSSRLRPGEYTVAVTGFNSDDDAGPASTATLVIAEPEAGTDWIIDSSVPEGGSFSYNEGLISSWYAPGADHFYVYWNNGDCWEWDGPGIWGSANLPEDGELRGYGVAVYPDGTTRRTQTYSWHQVSAGKITGAAASLPTVVQPNASVTIPYTYADQAVDMVYTLLVMDTDSGETVLQETQSTAKGNLTGSFVIPRNTLQEHHEYTAYFYANDAAEEYIYVEQIGSFLAKDAGTSYGITLRVAGEDESVTVAPMTDTLVHISAPGAKAVRLVQTPDIGDDWLNYDSEWEGGWGDHPEDIRLTRNWTGNKRITLVAMACYDDNWASDDAEWSVSNPVFVTLSEPEGTLPAPLMTAVFGAVEQGQALRVALSYVPEQADHVWYTVCGMEGEEYFQNIGRYGHNYYFVVPTAELTPGLYKLRAGYRAEGWRFNESFLFFEVTETAQEVYFESSDYAPLVHENYTVTAYVPGAVELQLLSDGVWSAENCVVDVYADSFTQVMSYGDSGAHTCYLRYLKNNEWHLLDDESLGEGHGAPLHINVLSVGTLASPSVSLQGGTAYAGEDLVVEISEADGRIEWGGISLYDEYWNYLQGRNIGASLNGTYTFSDLDLEEGEIYHLVVYSGALGYDGGASTMNFIPKARGSETMALTINGSEAPDPVPVNTDFTVEVHAPSDTTKVLLWTGDSWEEIYDIRWDDAGDPTDIVRGWCHGGAGMKYFFAKATSDSLANNPTWEQLNWSVFSNTVLLQVDYISRAGRPMLELLSDTVAHGAGLPIWLGESEHAQYYWVQVYDSQGQYLFQADHYSGDSYVLTDSLAPGGTYYLRAGTRGEPGYEDAWMEEYERFDYAFQVTEAAAQDLTFTVGTTSPLLGAGFPFYIHAPGAERVVLFEGEWEQQSALGDTLRGDTWCWQEDANQQYLQAVAEYADGTTSSQRVDLSVRVLGTTPDAPILLNASALEGDTLTITVGGDSASDNVHLWAWADGEPLADNEMGGRGTVFTLENVPQGTLDIHISAYGEPGYSPSNQNYQVRVLNGQENRLRLPPNTAVEEEAFCGMDSVQWVVLSGGTIGSRAFADCPNLSFVELGPNVTSIADDAFEGSPFTVILTTHGSYAAQWAMREGIGLRFLD